MLPLRRVTASRVRSDLARVGYTLHVFEGVGSAIVLRVHLACLLTLLTVSLRLTAGVSRS